MKIVEVTDSKQAREFIIYQPRFYRSVENYIRPLDQDVEAVFNPKKNKMFRHGECRRWLLVDDQGKTTGRVAAFYNEKQVNKDNDQPTGGIGFFDCVDDQDSANLLFRT